MSTHQFYNYRTILSIRTITEQYSFTCTACSPEKQEYIIEKVLSSERPQPDISCLHLTVTRLLNLLYLSCFLPSLSVFRHLPLIPSSFPYVSITFSCIFCASSSPSIFGIVISKFMRAIYACMCVS